MIVVTVDEISNIEKAFLDAEGITDIELMERASNAVSKHIGRAYKDVAIITGYGNNAGDGYALARLLSRDRRVTVYHPTNFSKFSSGAIENFNRLRVTNVKLAPYNNNYDFDKYDLIIDALIGVGLNREITDSFAEIINSANKSSAYKLSIDVPSGIFADSAQLPECAFKADKTIALSSYKICHTLYPAKEYSGEVACEDISIPEEYFKDIKLFTLNKSDIPKISARSKNSHKGSYGHSFIVGGSPEMIGAAAIASVGALRVGSGRTTCVYPKHADKGYLSIVPEIMTQSFEYDNPDSVIQSIEEKASVFLIGNGMGLTSEAHNFINNVVANTTKQVVIDADAFSALSLDAIENVKHRAVLTPHLKEFANLINVSVDEVINNTIELAKQFAELYKVELMLKSTDTVLAFSDGNTFVSSFGTPALAKGGTGDLLAGVVTGLLAQGFNQIDACKIACYIVGRSAEVSQEHEMVLTATDLIKHFGYVINEL